MKIELHFHAVTDLRKLQCENRQAAATVLAVLEQLSVDKKLLDKLTTHGDSQVGANRLSIKAWQSARQAGNFWRFRVLDTPATMYRVVYGYEWQTSQLIVLAVVHKEELDYDNLKTGIAKRILDDWCAL